MIVLLYVVAPLKMWREPMKAEPMHTEIHLEDLPAHARDSLIAIAAPLAALGFRAAAHTRSLNTLKNSETYQSVWLRESPGVIAFSFVVRNTSGPWPIRSFVTTLRTDFDDES